MTVHYEFAGRGEMPPVKMSWYDGGLMPTRRTCFRTTSCWTGPAAASLLARSGSSLYGTYGNNSRRFPTSLNPDAARVPQSIKRVTDSHELHWANAIMKKAEPSSDLAYAAKLNAIMLIDVRQATGPPLLRVRA